MSTVALVNKSFELKTSHLMLALFAGVLFTTWIMQNFILTRDVYYNLYSEQLEPQRIDEFVTAVKGFYIWNYFIGPLFLLIRLAFVTLLVQLPLVFKFVDISFAKLYRIVALAFVPLLLLSFIKILWLLWIPNYEITEHILSLIPFSINNFIDAENYPKHIYAFLGNFNLFEAAWGIILTTGLSRLTKLKKVDAAIIVLCIWTLIFVFQFVLITYVNKINS